jgi:lipoate synthase
VFYTLKTVDRDDLRDAGERSINSATIEDVSRHKKEPDKVSILHMVSGRKLAVAIEHDELLGLLNNHGSKKGPRGNSGRPAKDK